MEATTVELIEETPVRWRIDPRGAMRVPGIVFASRALLPEVVEDRSMEQVVNIATLPGIVVASYAMPDVHWGYGFPIGGVAATDVEAGGVVSPGGVGFDISCGVRLLASGLHQADVPECLPKLMDALAARIPRGLGRGAVRSLRNDTELAQVPAAAPAGPWSTASGTRATWNAARTAVPSATQSPRASASGPASVAGVSSAASARATTSWRCRSSRRSTTRRPRRRSAWRLAWSR